MDTDDLIIATLMAIATAIFTSWLTWTLVRKDVVEDCKMLGAFAYGDQAYECRLKENP